MFGLCGGAKKKRLLKIIALVDRCDGLLRIQNDSREAVDHRWQLHTPFAYGCKHESTIDQFFGEHSSINQVVAAPIGVQSGFDFWG